MRRLVLLALALVSAAVLLPGTSSASTPCRDRIYNDWYRDGKIASTYPLGCYRDALKHVPRDAAIYSSLKDDIRSALQAAVERAQGKQVPTSVGHGLPTPASSDVKNASIVKTSSKPSSSPKGTRRSTSSSTRTTASPAPTTTLSAAPAASTTGGGGGGLPVPILVLGGVALLLAATGAIGAGVRHFRR